MARQGHGMPRQGQGMAWLGMPRTRQGQGMAWQGKAMACQGMARQGMPRARQGQGMACQGQGKARTEVSGVEYESYAKRGPLGAHPPNLLRLFIGMVIETVP